MGASESEYDEAERIGELSVGRSVRLTARYPADAARLLSRNFFAVLGSHRGFDAKLMLTFADHLLQNVCSGSIDQPEDEQFLARVSAIPLRRAVRMAARHPEKGMKVLAAIVSKELREHQGLDQLGVVDFVNGFLDSFLGEMKAERGCTHRT